MKHTHLVGGWICCLWWGSLSTAPSSAVTATVASAILALLHCVILVGQAALQPATNNLITGCFEYVCREFGRKLKFYAKLEVTNIVSLQ